MIDLADVEHYGLSDVDSDHRKPLRPTRQMAAPHHDHPHPRPA
ncbi:hypothetical protein [Streptomyces scabiei]|nr:hypothetical protein [Streptomyces scabiei]